MSKLVSSEEFLERRRIVDNRVIRNRKKRPLHPDMIKDLLREKAAANVPVEEARHQKWLLILCPSETAIQTRSDGASFLANTKQFCDIRGSYEDAIRQRDDIMESGDYDQAWLILKTDRNR